MEPLTEIQIRFATRAVYPYFDSRHTGYFPRRSLKRRLTADIRFFVFFFFHPLYSSSLSSVRSYETRSKILAWSYYFSKEKRLIRADDPRKKIKSAKICNIYIYIYIEKEMYASKRIVKKNKLDLTIS